ncbi:putative quinol monooxygenase [Patulibacter sp.]|uniref:putative quinol monooxygenase n=1 Tax=Patulibacter sp. TaxID=1912859 RepID=UPI002721C5F9|nr:putative quinol monooxygenase [Patulibacter sp.]MDO9407813.1 putative quinol monooxygenase [Patulibacter sp.]
MTDVWIVGEYHVRPEHLDRVRTRLEDHERRTREEPGCLLAAASQDLDDPLVLRSIQRWEDEAALDVHRALPHVREMDGGAGERLSQPFELVRLRRG